MTNKIPVHDMARVTIDELTHLTNAIPSFMDSEFIMRVADLSMTLLRIQAKLAVDSIGEPEVNPIVQQIHDVLEATTEKLTARHAAQKNLTTMVGSVVH